MTSSSTFDSHNTFAEFWWTDKRQRQGIDLALTVYLCMLPNKCSQLDQTNPGYVPQPPSRTLPDRWERAFERAEIDDLNWKTA